MKKLTILLFSILISFNSYGEWTKVSTSVTAGDTFYIDKDTIKEHGGYVYYWRLSDYLTPNKYGTMSAKVYSQGDCGVNRYKPLSFIFYKQPMGRGSGKTDNTPNDWYYPTPISIGAALLMHACDYVK